MVLVKQSTTLKERLQKALHVLNSGASPRSEKVEPRASSARTAVPPVGRPGGDGAPALRLGDGDAGGERKGAEDVLFSWLHLSDLHFGYGDAERKWDQRLVLNALRDDVAEVAGALCPKPQAIFVTGDVAFSGATRRSGEYDEAKEWLLTVAGSVGLGKEDIFIVPGNHDVQRNADKEDRGLGRLVRILRSGDEPIDEALDHEADLLAKRQANYLAFAGELAPACLATAEGVPGELYWRHERATGGGLGIRIAGLNTAILAADDQDKGKLRLGMAQLVRALDGGAPDGSTIVLVMTHHPIREGWLGDEKQVSKWILNLAHVHLSGHVHEADALQVVSGGGGSSIAVVAGASYGDAVPGGPPASHGYNFGAVVRGPERNAQLIIWPRRWSSKNARFDVDVDNVPKGGKGHSRHEIKGIELRDEPNSNSSSSTVPAPAPQPPKATAPSLESAVQWINAAAERVRWIPIPGFQERYKIRLALDEIFVPLRLRAGRRKQHVMRADRLGEDYVESREVDLQGALRMAAEDPGTVGLVVLGDPGAGKTTLLKQLFMRVVKEGSAAVGLRGGLRPVLVRCSQFEKADFSARGLGLAVEREAARSGFARRGEALVESGEPILFLLDGLDEVRDEAAREALCGWLGDEVALWPGSYFVVTCRFAAWGRSQLLDHRFVPVDVLMLNEDAVQLYVNRWFAAVERGLDRTGSVDEAKKRAKESAQRLLEQLLDRKRQANLRLRDMTENPLLLSTLCLVHHSDWKLPDRRGDLYDRCISLLLEAWTKERTGAPVLSDKPARQVLQPLAWAMHSAEAREWPVDKVEEAIRGPLLELPEMPKSPHEFLERARDDCGVLASKDLGHFEFFHLSFQEYLAAVHAKEQGLVEELASHAGEPWWKEVILLAAAQPAMLGQLVRALAAKSGLEAHRELLRECVGESFQIKPEPFLEVIDRGLEGKWGGTATVRAVLELVGARAPSVLDRARTLVNHEDVAVSSQARALAGDIFLSYAREDEARAAAVAKVLTGLGWGVFWDRRIPPGKRFEDLIDQQLAHVSCVVVLWSAHSVNSDWVRAEAGEARQRGVLVPAVLEEGVKMPLQFRPFQTANLVGWSGGAMDHSGFADLLRGIEQLVSRPTAREASGIRPTTALRAGARIAQNTPREGQPFRERTTDMSFLWVPPGKFWMGSSKKQGEPNFDGEASDRETPPREVTLTDGFWIAEFPVTNAQYSVFLEKAGTKAPAYWRDRRFNAPDQPLVGVDWEESRSFAKWLTEQANLGGAFHIDLPSEAEWEYAARGKDGRKFPWVNDTPTRELADFGQDLEKGKATAVGVHPAGRSPWGVQDMAGGVWEWCLDGWQDSYVNMRTNIVNPCHLPGSGAPRVIRGGSWRDGPGSLRCAYRFRFLPDNRRQYLGFRVVCRGFRQYIDG